MLRAKNLVQLVIKSNLCTSSSVRTAEAMATLSKRGQVAVVTLKNPPLNVLSYPTRASIVQSIKEAEQDASVKSIVLCGSGRSFSAGADITEFGNPDLVFKEPNLIEVTKAVEACSKPVVAVMHGTSLGGGVELALGCHYRLLHKAGKLGLPEVHIGLVPGATGTQKVPRVMSIPDAIDMITSGRHISAKEAYKMGIVDKVLEDDYLDEGVAFAESVANDPVGPRRVSQMPVKVDETTPMVFKVAYEKVAAKARGMYSPLFCVKAIEAATKASSFEEGLQMEGYISKFLGLGDQSRALQYAFFSERAVSKWSVPDGSTSYKTAKGQEVKSAAVIGAGTMGVGITMSMVLAGIPTYLTEQNQEYLDKGLKMVQGFLAHGVKQGRMSEDKAKQIFSLVRPTLSYDDLKDVDVVVEAVFENMALKKEIFKKLDGVCKPSAVLASNTSTLDIDEMASATTRPDKVMGMHFFSPAHIMKLLENIRGKDTSPETMATAMDLGKRMKKVSVLVGNCPGFVGNRMLAPYSKEAIFLLEEGALPHEVDQTLEDFGLAMGLCRMGDLAGLDIGYKSRKEFGYIQREGQDDFLRKGERYSPLSDWLVESGRLGQKTGKGFYNYGKPGGRKPEADPEVTQMIMDVSQKAGITRRHIPAQEILERCLYGLINEGFKCLEEQIASSDEDIDMVWLYGYGWPRHTGGPMYYAKNIVGLPKLLERILYYHFQHPNSPYWKPSQLLIDRVSEDHPHASKL
ncbi:peroxisomal bifunctional enzyme-like isoform X1 [Lytechinus variegatus]|uniref:peroxisomal bifunctional enzyme-like isoform X1 n=1 Tax=Lytechinus variegatus TaxID=7654 RepID=UPI001BB2B222|nr:peroxisomal bifunctional enzyme-like isoform X1 [Lytechinus variegatus]